MVCNGWQSKQNIQISKDEHSHSSEHKILCFVQVMKSLYSTCSSHVTILGDCSVCYMLQILEVMWVPTNDIRTFFEFWMSTKILRLRKRECMIIFFALLWAICQCRNSIIFPKKEISIQEAVHMTKLWLTRWHEERIVQP